MPLVLRLAAIALAGIVLSLTLPRWAQKAPGKPVPSASANLLFSSGFEGTTALTSPSGFYGTGAWQGLVGIDSITGFAWPPNIWGGGATHFQLLVNAPIVPVIVDNYMVNQIQTVTGRSGNPTRALYSEIKQSGCCGTNPGGGATQDPFMIQPVGETGDLYISYWIKFQPDLVQLMAPPSPNWRVLFEWKTGTQGDDGDYRVIVELVTWGPGGPLSWYVAGDNVASSSSRTRQIYWEKYATTTAQTLGDWMKFEVFWHRSGNFNNKHGRVWMAVNGQVIADVSNANLSSFTCFTPCNTSMMGINNTPINRVMVSQLYTSTGYPIYQWVDDVQIWDGFPPDAAPH